MSEQNGNGDQYIRYSTKELLTTIIDKVERVDKKLDDAIVDLSSQVRSIDHRITVIESKDLYSNHKIFEDRLTKLERESGNNEAVGKYKRWLIPTIIGLIIAAADPIVYIILKH